jgi:hypothetical protein
MRICCQLTGRLDLLAAQIVGRNQKSRMRNRWVDPQRFRIRGGEWGKFAETG